MTPETKTFTIRVEGECTMTAEEVWPDGDGPAHPTTADVARFISENWSTVPTVIDEWNLPCSISVDGEEAIENL
jgi:hypothetical protein